MNIEAARAALKKYFGYDAFRPMQAEIIEAIYAGKDALVLMPTGGGKSICFQIPAVTMEGVCVVVSPLIALMKDQVEALKANGIAADFINSSQSSSEQMQIENRLRSGELKLIYISPEKLLSSFFTSILSYCKVSLFAIDEAHCISSWGHDFRPEYAQMSLLKRQFPNIPVVALTATADRLTRKDVVDKLELVDPAIFVASFDRPNIYLDVRPGQQRLDQIVDFIKSRPDQSGIIYCLSRKTTEDVAAKLRAQNIQAGHYHAQTPTAERNKIQEAFINDRLQIVVATVAFGMGIDKSNVRWVIHYNLPKNIENYYQEIGRSGRDGTKAHALLFFSMADVMTYRDMLGKNESENKEIQLSKLEQMIQFAEARICRRRLLINYFSEHFDENCNNCDVCKNPPVYLDGTQIAQMALSAVARLKEQVGVQMLVDVLRGSNRSDLIENGYHNIKTYGVGRQYKPFDWNQYILQIIQLGYLEIAYEEKNQLRLTPASQQVLRDGKKVELIQPQSFKERKAEEELDKAARQRKRPEVSARERSRNELFDVLRDLRRTMALALGFPPYIIFSDATLEEMAAKAPTTESELLQISGVGEAKFRNYGDEFLKAIRNYVKDAPSLAGSGVTSREQIFRPFDETKPKAAAKTPGSTQIVTLEMFRKGMSPEEIAEERLLSESSIYNHLAQLYEKGEDVDISTFVKPDEIVRVTEFLALNEAPKLKEIFDYFSEEISYPKIRFAVAHYRRLGVKM